MNIRNFNFWVIAKPAEDVPGEWVAHCLEVDVVSQGRSLNHSFAMVAEAVAMVVTEDLAAGRQPTDRRAPEEFWRELWNLANTGKPFSVGSAPDDDVKCAAAQLVLTVFPIAESTPPLLHRPSSPPPPEPLQWKVPVAWGGRGGFEACA